MVGRSLGIAGSLHTEQFQVGSPGYMAPELMMRPANEKTDAFALGVVLWGPAVGGCVWVFLFFIV